MADVLLIQILLQEKITFFVQNGMEINVSNAAIELSLRQMASVNLFVINAKLGIKRMASA